jgi:hypothetical protein
MRDICILFTEKTFRSNYKIFTIRKLEKGENEMKLKSKWNLIIDLILFIILIPIFVSRGNLHELFGYLFGILTLTHVILHWKQIYSLIKICFPKPALRQIIVSTFCIICLITLFLSMNQSGRNHKERGFTNRNNYGFNKRDY